MTVLKRIILTALVSASLLGSSCHRESRLNVIVISIDTLRDDHCSMSGYERPTTPFLEKLASQSTRMQLAYAPTATTAPSHASLFSSLYPITHGVVKNGVPLDPSFETLAETLGEHGYATAAVVSSYVLNAKFGFDQGFDDFDDDFDPAGATIERDELGGEAVTGAFDQRADAATDKAIALLENLGREAGPFFLFVHYFDPHAPYVPPPGPWAARFDSGQPGDLARAVDAYDAEIAFTDDEIGRLLGHLEQADLPGETLVVITSDHGEGLMQHGHMRHGLQIYEEAVRVPLLFHLPGRVSAGQALDEPVELVDVMPTVLELAGVVAENEIQGRSLAGALAGDAELDPDRPVFLHRRHYESGWIGEFRVSGEKFGIRRGPWKYVEGEEGGPGELFNLEDDPAERVNLLESSRDVADGLSLEIRAWREAHGRGAQEIPPLSDEDRERLKALGYVE